MRHEHGSWRPRGKAGEVVHVLLTVAYVLIAAVIIGIAASISLGLALSKLVLP